MAGPDTFMQDVQDVVAWSRGEALADDHPFCGVRAQPLRPTAPQPWILGSTPYTAGLAAHLGLPYCFAHFFNDGGGRRGACPLSRLVLPEPATAGSPREPVRLGARRAERKVADRLFAAYAHWRLDRDRGRVTPFPSPEDIAAHDHGAAVTERMSGSGSAPSTGRPIKWRRGCGGWPRARRR